MFGWLSRPGRQFLLILGAGVLSSAPVAGQTFVRKTEELGIIPGGGSACWFDMNNDGWADLSAAGRVYLNRRGVQFVHVADVGAEVAADYDNDGLTDLYGGRTVYRNLGGNSFAAVPMPELPVGGSQGASWADLNGDGYVDLYVGGYEAWPAETYADFILHNRGGRGFAVSWSEVRYRARGVTACDYDRDGDMDIYVSNYRLQPNILWQNQGDYSFLDKAAEFNALATDRGFGGGHSIGSCWGDFNDDGHIDLFAGNFAHNDARGHQPESHCLLNRGPEGNFHFQDLGQRGVFYQESYASPAAGDYDNDGDLDLFFTTVYGTASFGVPNHPVLYRNDGTFNFGDATGGSQLGGLPPTYQAAWADYDNDGDLDLMTAGELFENQGGTGHSWLKVTLKGDGKTVNRSAIGAQVRISLPGGRILTRQVEAGTGQGNQNDLTLHFGLGTHRAPVDLEIFWPDGTTQRVAGVALEQTITLNREPLVEILSPPGALALEAGQEVILEGRGTDAGVTTAWSVTSAPEGSRVQIGDETAPLTSVRFSDPGEYIVQLTGEKDGTTSLEALTFTVLPAGPQVRPAAWWKLDEKSGSLVNDSSGNELHGTRARFANANEGWIPDGVRGGALAFNPDRAEHVRLDSYVSEISALREGTLAMWIRTTSTGGWALFSVYNDGGNNEVGLFLRDGFLEFRAWLEGEPAPRTIRSSTLVNDGLWHHVAVSCDQAGVATLFLDGEISSVGRLPFFFAVSDANRMTMARANDSVLYRGDLDDVRVYPRSLTAGEIATLLNPGESLAQAPLIFLPGDRITIPGDSFPLAGFEPHIAGGALDRWEQVSGPGTAQFSDATQRTGSITFPVPGTYILRVVAANESASSVRELTVVHTGGPAGSPASFGLKNLNLPQSGTHVIALDPVFQDPDDADSALEFTVTVAPAGEALLESVEIVGGGAAGPATLVLNAASDAEGTVHIRVRVVDPAGQIAVADFTVSIANSPPVTQPISLTLAENAASGQQLGVIPAADPDGDPVRFHIVSGNEREAFTVDSATGEIRVRNGEVLDFETTSQYDLQVAVIDPDHPVFDRTTSVAITITDVSEDPVVTDQRFLVRGDSPADTLVGRVTGSDPDGGALSYAIVGGDPGAVFAIDSASGDITVTEPVGLRGQSHFDLVVRGTDPSGATADASVAILPLRTLIAEGANVKWQVPTDDSEDASWRDLDHDDSLWTESPLGLGYEHGSGYESLIVTDVGAEMAGQNTTIYVRNRFPVANPNQVGSLILRLRYDDGFLAYLNGTLVAARFAPDEPDWQSGAIAGHADTAAVLFEDFEIGWASELLVPGDNVLAIHGLNYLISSSDYLLSAELLSALPRTGVEIVPEGAEVRWKVPADGSEDEDWTEHVFDDSTWNTGPLAVGYDDEPNYLPHISTNVAAEMQGVRAGIYLRLRFDVPDPAAYSRLWLDMKYDDGFAAFFNGLYATGANDPPLAELTWESEATMTHEDPAALVFQRFDLGAPGAWVQPGENVIALHGLNAGLGSSDFLLSARLMGDALVLPPSGPVSLYHLGFSGVTRTKAQVDGEVASLGGAPAHLFVVWGERDHGENPDAWPGRSYVGKFEEAGNYTGRLFGLEAGRDYIVRVFARRVESGEVDGWGPAVGVRTASHPATTLVAEGGPVQALIPISAADAPGWTEATIAPDPARWLGGTSAVGFDRNGVFAEPPALDLLSDMHGVNAGAYLRFPFVLGDPAGLEALTLRMKYDDGFVAYLNGTEIARANAPGVLAWNEPAPQSRFDQDVETFVEFDVSAFRGALLTGSNVLAIHGFNWRAIDSDFLILPELVADGDPGVLNPFDSWAFGQGLYGADAQPESDSDGNGRTAFEEFSGVTFAALRPSANGASLTLRYERRAGLVYEVQISGNLVDWSAVTPAEEEAELLAGGEFESATVRIATAVGGGERAFVRIVASLPIEGVTSQPGLTLLDEQAIARALVPQSPVPGWREPEFDDSLWTSGPLAVGYERSSGYENLIGLDLGGAMYDIHPTAFVRVPFLLADPSTLETLTLRMKYDDGFVAYLNGVRVASAYTDPSAPLTWQSGAREPHDDAEALVFEEFDLNGYLATLLPGRNVLAIHALNAGTLSSDLLILPELVATGGAQEISAFDLWALHQGLSGEAARPDADPDEDGTDNYGEFAVAGAPLRYDAEVTAPRVALVNGGGYLDVTFRRRLDAADAGVTVEVESSSDLRTWRPPSGSVEVDFRPAPDGLAELVTVRVPVSGESGFVRLVAR